VTLLDPGLGARVGGAGLIAQLDGPLALLGRGLAPALGLVGFALEPIGLLGGGEPFLLGIAYGVVGAPGLVLEIDLGAGALISGLHIGALLSGLAVAVDLLLAFLGCDLVTQPLAFGLDLGGTLVQRAPGLALAGILGGLLRLQACV
jgi:hypothetical protein